MHLQDVSRHYSRPRAAPGWARGSSRDDRDHTQGSVVGKRYTFVPDCEQGPYAYLPVCVGFIAYGPGRTRMRQDVWPVVRYPYAIRVLSRAYGPFGHVFVLAATRFRVRGAKGIHP